MHCISLISSAHINPKLTLSRSLPPAGSHLPPSPGIMRSEEAFSVVWKKERCKHLEGIRYCMPIQTKHPLCMISIWCWCQRKSHQGFSTVQERVLFEQRRKVQTLNGIWGSKLCSDIYRLSPHLWGKTYKSFEHPVFAGRIPKARVSCIVSEDNRCQNGKWNKRCQEPERWNDEDSVFLPDHFLYRGVVRTVVRVLGRVGGRKKKKKNHWL